MIERGKIDSSDQTKESDVKKQVMLEDGLQDVDKLHAELDKDVTGAKYLKMENCVAFSKMCSCDRAASI